MEQSSRAHRRPSKSRRFANCSLSEGVQVYKKEGPKFMLRLVAKQKAKVKGS